jgi:hypothetical protein
MFKTAGFIRSREPSAGSRLQSWPPRHWRVWRTGATLVFPGSVRQPRSSHCRASIPRAFPSQSFFTVYIERSRESFGVILRTRFACWLARLSVEICMTVQRIICICENTLFTFRGPFSRYLFVHLFLSEVGLLPSLDLKVDPIITSYHKDRVSQLNVYTNARQPVFCQVIDSTFNSNPNRVQPA